MTDYIRRDTLIEDIDEAVKHRGMGEIIAQTLRRYILRQPAADVAEVVRCKDRKHSYTKNRPCYTALFRWCRKWDNIVRDCDFCSYGERKGDNVSD